jgi:hypothetical protein
MIDYWFPISMNDKTFLSVMRNCLTYEQALKYQMPYFMECTAQFDCSIKNDTDYTFMKFKYRGKYCGPGYSHGEFRSYDPNSYVVPEDEIDAACKEHDAAYYEGGDLAHADLQLVKKVHFKDPLLSSVIGTQYLLRKSNIMPRHGNGQRPNNDQPTPGYDPNLPKSGGGGGGGTTTTTTSDPSNGGVGPAPGSTGYGPYTDDPVPPQHSGYSAPVKQSAPPNSVPDPHSNYHYEQAQTSRPDPHTGMSFTPQVTTNVPMLSLSKPKPKPLELHAPGPKPLDLNKPIAVIAQPQRVKHLGRAVVSDSSWVRSVPSVNKKVRFVMPQKKNNKRWVKKEVKEIKQVAKRLGRTRNKAKRNRIARRYPKYMGSMPVSFGSQQGSLSQYRKKSTIEKGSVILTSITGAGQTAGAILYSFDLSPTNTLLPTCSLGIEAQKWDYFHCLSARFRYTGSCSTATAGLLIMGVFADPEEDAAFQSLPQERRPNVLQSLIGSKKFNVWTPNAACFRPRGAQNVSKFSVHDTEGEERWTTPGTFYIIAANTLPSATLGDITYDYSFKFINPHLTNLVGSSSGVVTTSSTSVSDTAPFGTSRTSIGNIPVSFSSTTVTVGAVGNYIALYELTGGVIASCAMAPASGTTEYQGTDSLVIGAGTKSVAWMVFGRSDANPAVTVSLSAASYTSMRLYIYPAISTSARPRLLSRVELTKKLLDLQDQLSELSVADKTKGKEEEEFEVVVQPKKIKPLSGSRTPV